MAKDKVALAEGKRRCIGSERYGFAAHITDEVEFPLQPSQPGGIGRMCKTHWNQYTAGLARDRKAKMVADGTAPAPKAPRVKAEKPAKKAKAETPDPVAEEASDEGQSTLAQAAKAARERRKAVGRPAEVAAEA